MTNRELMAARYVAVIVAANGDSRRMANTLRDTFAKDERDELKTIALKALADLRKRELHERP
jgi:hypothetical protein